MRSKLADRSAAPSHWFGAARADTLRAGVLAVQWARRSGLACFRLINGTIAQIARFDSEPSPENIIAAATAADVTLKAYHHNRTVIDDARQQGRDIERAALRNTFGVDRHVLEPGERPICRAMISNRRPANTKTG